LKSDWHGSRLEPSEAIKLPGQANVFNDAIARELGAVSDTVGGVDFEAVDLRKPSNQWRML